MKFVDVYNVISMYYPIGIDKRDPTYELFSGSFLLKEKTQAMYNDFNYKKWTQFTNTIQNELSIFLYLKANPAPFDVCYSFETCLTERIVDNITYSQKLICQVSVLGDFFCIYGQDTVEIAQKESMLIFDPILTVSPIDIYEDYYIFVCIKIKEAFPTHLLIPHYMLRKRIDNLKIVTSKLKEGQNSSVYQALFRCENITDYHIRGNPIFTIHH